MPYYTMRDGEQIFAYVIGQGFPCVWLIGLGGAAKYWLPLITTLKGLDCQFILMDPRGWGESALAKNTKPWFEQVAEDMDDLLDALGHSQAKLIGCSQGAYSSLVKYKVTGFSRISNFLLYEHAIKVAPASDYQYGINPAVLKTYRAAVDTWRRLKLDDPRVPFKKLPREFQRAYKELFLATIENCFHSYWSGKFNTILFSFAFFKKTNIAWHGLIRSLEDYIDHDYGISLSDLNQMTLPVTLVYGCRSRLFQSVAMLEMASSMPNVKVIAFEKSGHALFVTEAWKIRAALVRFLQEPPQIAASQLSLSKRLREPSRRETRTDGSASR